MRFTKKVTKTVLIGAGSLLLALGAAHAQVAVNLTAARTSTTMPDGNIIPMWGWSCGTVTGTGAACTQTNGQPQTLSAGLTTTWQPPLITVPTGQSLTITLSNQLPVATSLTIVGQLPNATPDANGPGNPTRENGRPQHNPQTATTWTTAVTNQAQFTPPTQGARAESFVQEATAATCSTSATTGVTCTPATTGSITYTFNNLLPGTYLVETGSYPSIQGPMGLYGVLVVTKAPSGTGSAFTPGVAYPSPCGAVATTTCLAAGGVPYDGDAVLLLSEIDAVQNSAADKAVLTPGFSPFTPWSPACSPTGSQNPAVPSAPNTCYPPAVDYTPTYYLINGHGFDRTNPAANAVSVGSADSTGTVLLRFVNAGLRMHMPSVAGLQMALIAEDSHLQPDVALAFTKGTSPATCSSGNLPIKLGPTAAACPKVQNDFFMPAGKVLDIAVKPAGTAGGTYTANPYPVFARDLALSTNSQRDGGMQAFVLVNAGTPTVSTGGAGNPPAGTVTGYSGTNLSNFTVTAQANADVYILPANSTAPFTFNVLANDVGVTNAIPKGATQCAMVGGAQAAGQTNCLYLNGMYTYVPATANAALSFSYCGNGATSGATCATVNVNAATIGAGPMLGAPPSFSTAVNTLMNVSEPGVLTLDKDPTGYRLYASVQTAAPAAGTAGTAPQTPAIGVAAPLNVVEGTPTGITGGCTITLQSNGSFTAQSPPSATGNTCTFQYYAINSQGTASAAQTVTLHFPPPSNLNVAVIDGVSGAIIGDYKWVIEQDLTFKIDPACEVNVGSTGTVPTGSDGRPCPAGGANHVPPTLATNFASSYSPVIASGCTGPQSCERGQSIYNPVTGSHVPAACNHGVCMPTTTGSLPTSLPSQVQLNALDADGNPARYYISILPGDAANPFNTGYSGNVTAACQTLTLSSPTTATGQQVTQCGHTMGGMAIPATLPSACTGTGSSRVCTYPNAATTGTGALASNPLPGSANDPIVIPVQPNPLLTATLTVFVFEDDAPLNGEHDVGGNNNEPGLGGFQVEVWDEMAQAGDFTGQMTYDIFNNPLSNSLNGMIDPLTGLDACPVGATGPDSQGNQNQVASGMIIICPQYEADGATPSPLVGNAVIKNLMPGRFGVIVHPSAAREAAGEVWYQTNTLDGTHYLDTFVRVGEPAYFQEYGPGGWHAFMGMANPAVINARKPGFCNALPAGSCGNTVKGQVTNLHENRAPDETLYDSGVFAQGDPRNYQAFAHTQCWASLGDPDGLTFAFTLCDANGNYSFAGVPDGNWALTIGDVWNDFIIDGASKPVNVCTGPTCVAKTANPYNIDSPTFSWQTHIWSNAFMDLNGNGIQDDPVLEPGLIQVPIRIRMRNGRFNNTQFTDNTGHAHFNETFPLFSWYVTESDDTRFKNTGVHVVYDFGGQIDGPAGTNCLAAATNGGSSNQGNSAASPCGNGNPSGTYAGILNSLEPAAVSLPTALQYPGSYYCQFGDCSELNGVPGFPAAGRASSGPLPNYNSTGRIDPGSVVSEGLQGFLSQTQILEWGKQPYSPGENGGIRGHVVYASTRPFDDPTILFQNLWEPLVPNVTINLYSETAAPDGTVLLKLVDSTVTTSWDAFAQGHHMVAGAPVPNMSCPGQPTSDPYFDYTLAGTPNYLDQNFALPNNSQFKCYDGMHNFNQVQPAPYDGLYLFPSASCSVAGGTFTATVNGQAVGGTCGEVANPNAGQPGSTPTILPPGKYVVEVVVPPGYELVKEEDKNILMGDNFVASSVISPQFSGIGDIFIVPDQAAINQNNINGVYNPAMYSNLNNPSYTGPINGTNPYAGCAPNTSCPPAGNNSNPTQTMGRDTFAGFGPGGLLTLNTPCVGEERIVPDFMSISPESGEVAPFAGATRPLCDRKEVTLEDQMQGQTDFFVWTKTPAATHFTGFILDDFSSEFDQSSPTFGEKFAIPNLPVAIKDFNGVEVSRTYSDQWGLFNGLLFSTWEVNPPNPTGYAPGMWITEMNSPGPINAPVCITAPTATTQGFPAGCVTNQTNPPTVKVTDPYFNPGYSTFDYENPFMPADTVYLDTPIIPVMAFAEAYNPPDCAYPDATPAIGNVTAPADTLALNAASGPGGASRSGPWVAPVTSGSGHQLVITALGDQVQPNYAYSGPAAKTAPFNQTKLTRHYGFGSTTGSVSLGTVTLPATNCTANTGCINSWSDTSITITVPNNLSANNSQNVPLCSASNPTYGVYGATGANTTARCGELVITTSTGKRSVDSVMVTIGGKKPTFIASEKVTFDTFGTNNANSNGNSIQTAIDAAAPGDLIIVGPGVYTEMVQMWKPVRLQGVAAATTIINANTQPAGKLDPWRRRLNCLFGLTLSGQQQGVSVGASTGAYDPTGQYSCTGPMAAATNVGGLTTVPFQAAVDPIQLEPVIGWDSNLNGNISELLQEPTLMGAYEGAAVTVLAKGLENFTFGDTGTTCDAEGNPGCVTLNNCPNGAAVNATNNTFTCNTTPTGSGHQLGDCNPGSYFHTSNFQCNPSRIDGFTMTNSSQGGGAVFIHGWNHYLEVSNNRLTGNAGTLTGGITVGQPEVPDSGLGGTACNTLTAAVSPITGVRQPITLTATDAAPLCIQTNVNMHNNSITFNSSYGDELNSNTPAAAGGVTINAGSDRYAFTHNFVCGNMSSGDGGGMTHYGLSFQGDIEHNAFVFNQSTNPTLTTNGGGLIVEGAAPDGTLAENSQIDVDGSPSLSDGVGPGIVVNANLMMGNTAESGEGGGLRLQSINGNDIFNNPSSSSHWYSIAVTNNVIVNNVAGWEGGGVSIQDAVNVLFENNTVVSNDETSTAGVLFDTLGAPDATTPPPNCNPDTGTGCTNPITSSVPQTAGLVTHPHSLLLLPAFTNKAVTCPNAGTGVGQAGYTTTAGVSSCTKVSLPVLSNDIFYNNRPFNLTVAGSPAVVVLAPPLSQSPTPAWSNGVVTGGTGACGTGSNYWDIGVYGDTTISGGNPGGFKLNPTYSILTSLTGPGTGYGAAAAHNSAVGGAAGQGTSGQGLFTSLYCNGSRVPPEIAPKLCTVNSAAAPGTGSQTPGCIYPGSVGITTPPGVPDQNPFYEPFSLTPAATVDEGNNWINMFYGPLTTVNPTIPRATTVGDTSGNTTVYGNPLGNYAPLNSSSLMVGKVPVTVGHTLTDFYGNLKPLGATDAGAIEHGPASGTILPAAVRVPPAPAGAPGAGP
jgi:hypothetical protein